jgi:hypothetical protein
MDPELVEVLSRGEELLGRAQEVARKIEERTRELMHDGGRPARTAARRERARTRFSAAPCAPHAHPLLIEPLSHPRLLLYRERRAYLKAIQGA